jgi:DNA invertase Pin-like site-specific DNA recombinase
MKKAGCEEIFVEKASGAQRDRPQLKAALRHARKGGTIVVWKLDRLARSMRQLIATVEDLEARKIGFKSLTDPIDTTSPGGRLVFHIFSALAEFERGNIRERTLAGLATARARGSRPGRKPSLGPKDIAAASSAQAS